MPTPPEINIFKFNFFNVNIIYNARLGFNYYLVYIAAEAM